MTTGSKIPGVPLGKHRNMLGQTKESRLLKDTVDKKCVPVGELCPAEGGGSIFTDKQSQVAVCRKTRNPGEAFTLGYTRAELHPINCPTFIVAAVRKVLALDDLLHDVACIDAGVVHTAGLPLHQVLLPPDDRKITCV